MRLRYSARAIRHLHAIDAYIRERSPQGARGVGRRIRRAAEQLMRFPLMGHPGTAAGTREIGVPGLPYIIVHSVHPDHGVVVLGIYHGAQLRPGQAVSDQDRS